MLLLFLPAVAQEEPKHNGLLVYGALGSAYVGGGLVLNGGESGMRRWAEVNMVNAGIGYHWGRLGMMASAGAEELSSGVASGDWLFTISQLPVRLHAVYDAPRGWQSTQPTLGAYVECAPIASLPYTEVGVEAGYRFYVLSPSLRASWRWTDPGGWNVQDFMLTAGLELGGVWALGR
jgi:hypothetical protein